MSIVSIVKGTDPEVMVKEAIELIGGLDSKPRKQYIPKIDAPTRNIDVT